MNHPFGIHWFRRDLRVADNPALTHNLEQNNGRVLCLFCFDSKFLARDDFSTNRFAFFLDSLLALKQELKARGGDLLVADCLPQKAFAEIAAKLSPSLVTYNRDYEPFARARDKEVADLLAAAGVTVESKRDHLIFEPNDILKDDGKFYQIYSPYARRWLERFRPSDFAKAVRATEKFKMTWREVKAPFADALDLFIKKNRSTVPVPVAGEKEALKALRSFKSSLADYGKLRDTPSVPGTSRLSHFLKNGSLTTSQIVRELDLKNFGFTSPNGANKYLKELIWREFYYSILWHEPRVETEPFLRQYKNLKWVNNENWFNRWCEGTTGYPIVDAGMRELNSTGWMHNRVRMIVASFLTKDLLIDWRWGEEYFMKMLIDGDLAANNGGWQWAASTGCDPQPYFRVFNPALQSVKFDPDGNYIRTFVPELRHLDKKAIHAPGPTKNYPAQIVDHSTQRNKAIELYRSARIDNAK